MLQYLDLSFLLINEAQEIRTKPRSEHRALQLRTLSPPYPIIRLCTSETKMTKVV